MTGKHLGAVVAVLAVAVATLGCKPRTYRAETVIHSDGSVSRAIYQPLDATPFAARKADGWTTTTFARYLTHDDWTGPIDALSPAAYDEEHPYFAAWGEFPSASRIPQTYVKKAPAGLPEGQLLLDYQRDDYGLVVDHRWVELLTDIVTIDDMHRARQELAEQMFPLLPQILAAALGDEYDTTKLAEWLESTGKPWFFEITDVVFSSGTRGELFGESMGEALVPICARRGLVLTDASGKLLEGDALQAVLAEYVRSVLRDTLRRHDGKKVSEGTLTTLIEWVGMKEHPDDSEWRYAPLNAAAEKVVTERFGSVKGFQEALSPLLARILGLYASELFQAPHRFHYTLELPGSIVTTNGTLLSDRAVRWEFGGDDAFPFGYRMECRSLEQQGELERELLGRQVLVDNPARLRYVELMNKHAELNDALRACGREKSLEPFYKARAKAKKRVAEAFDAMAGLLQLPERPAQ